MSDIPKPKVYVVVRVDEKYLNYDHPAYRLARLLNGTVENMRDCGSSSSDGSLIVYSSTEFGSGQNAVRIKTSVSVARCELDCRPFEDLAAYIRVRLAADVADYVRETIEAALTPTAPKPEVAEVPDWRFQGRKIFLEGTDHPSMDTEAANRLAEVLAHIK